jgi:hypothetical protein
MMKKINFFRLLVILGRINPAIWDAIIPHGPAHAALSAAAAGSEVELNPQPLPPAPALQVASAKVAKEIAQAAIAAEASGHEGASKIVARAIDEWCGTPPGHAPIPWPGPWPFPWKPDRQDPELDVEASQLVGALTLASIASRMAKGEAQTALAAGAEQLLETSLSE